MSVRWAILTVLAEHANSPMTAAETGIALQACGITSSAQNFGGNVSAVLRKIINAEKWNSPQGYQITGDRTQSPVAQSCEWHRFLSTRL
jgi:hypothetical protein